MSDGLETLLYAMYEDEAGVVSTSTDRTGWTGRIPKDSAVEKELVSKSEVVEWLKEHRENHSDEYGKHADNGDSVQKHFEAGAASAIDQLLQELGESPEPDTDYDYKHESTGETSE